MQKRSSLLNYGIIFVGCFVSLWILFTVLLGMGLDGSTSTENGISYSFFYGEEGTVIPPGSDLASSRQEHLILAGYRDGPAPQFPGLSPYSRYENYTHTATNNPYMIATWYFNEERKFLESQKKKVGFLETTGTISSVELNFTKHILRFGKSAPGIQDSQNRHTVPERIKATGYESIITSGYFFTVTIPGVGVLPAESGYAVNKEYYLVYYGTTTEANITSQTLFLKDIIAQTYRYDHMPSVGALI